MNKIFDISKNMFNILQKITIILSWLNMNVINCNYRFFEDSIFGSIVFFKEFCGFEI